MKVSRACAAALAYFVSTTALGAPARAATIPTATLLVPLNAFATAFNSAQRVFPSTVFTEDCTTIDEFDPFEWHGAGSIRVWYRETTGGGTARGYQHFLAAHEVLALDPPRMVRQRGNNAYVVVPTRLQYNDGATRRLQHLDWTVAERLTPGGWRIAAQAWALLDDTAVQAASDTRIPFRTDRGVIVFEAFVNGQGPLSFVFDPGAGGALTTTGASRLGINTGSKPQPLTVRIGDAEIQNVALPVYQGDPADIFRGDSNQPPIAGALGPEILNRFAVRVDYASHTLSLTPLDGFVYTGKGVALPFTIRTEDNIPLVHAAVDGIDGLFQYDVRAPAGIFLFAPFIDSSGLGKRYPAGSKTVASLTVAGTTLKDVATRFGTMRTGKFGTSAEAGLLGYGVLSKFTTTIDYAHKLIYFEALP